VNNKTVRVDVLDTLYTLHRSTRPGTDVLSIGISTHLLHIYLNNQENKVRTYIITWAQTVYFILLEN
jgi:hypothetical protein